MNILDNFQKIKDIDKQNVYSSIESLADQCLDAWNNVEKIKIPENYRNFKNIIVSGMGGSSLGAHLIQSLFEDKLCVPLVLLRDYHLPAFANKESLIILSSYSGTTEETINCAREAIKKHLRCFVISTGGELGEIAQKNNFPFYKINPVLNPSNQPRMAIGYSVFGQIAVTSRLGLIATKKDEVVKMTKFIKTLCKQYSLFIPLKKNPAKKLANKLKDKIINLVSAQHLQGALHVFNNQLNENSKNFSNFFYIPELNHHLMEGLKNPESLKNVGFFVFIESDLYAERIKKRFKITQEVVKRNGLPFFTQKLVSKTPLTQCLELITFGAFVNFYLAILYGNNPAPIPWVDFFKDQMKK